MIKSLKLIPLLIITLILSACSGVAGKEVTVGGKNFTEQYILSEMTAFLLVEEGFKVNQMNNLGSSVVRSALVNGQVDLMWEYTGTALITYMGEESISDPEEAFQKVKEIDSENDIHWMNMSEVNNTYALVMRSGQAEELGIESISDLGDYINENPGELSMASDAEFANRSDGLPGVEETYGFEFGTGQVNQMDLGLTQRSLNNEQVDVSVAFETDATIRSYDLVVLEDDEQFFPPYRAAVTINQEVFEEYPEIEEITARLAENLNSDIMRELNYLVDVEGQSVSVVAYDWLVENGFLEEE
ncbi:glycine betaine ABC transporter substrate-binding protein [Planococcus sp. CP5-4]|uniref:glycine betaine ABC transporter substrate-binding protein n=1 Tax=unclassified Planococcus (in: firmicutes) TaxID=2662419 RepID=UPI001C223FBD|nr:glycine betaine ABC transporter substrate-binding protein [Planococcus sp. CP5-4]MBU9675167.1 glycine betaine ABC transporter substrate-binding protein [Planococcus sp. CP5-4_YE]MBV0908873.1 glycine betaine ABC transporter substrate-binding protein [Planococcus sp. CP5-4_UN]MBW6063922.1 glycine betaine ABC transporter substrate-binding protein [Planococcus sp. CP5-4]